MYEHTHVYAYHTYTHINTIIISNPIQKPHLISSSCWVPQTALNRRMDDAAGKRRDRWNGYQAVQAGVEMSGSGVSLWIVIHYSAIMTLGNNAPLWHKARAPKVNSTIYTNPLARCPDTGHGFVYCACFSIASPQHAQHSQHRHHHQHHHQYYDCSRFFCVVSDCARVSVCATRRPLCDCALIALTMQYL